MKADRVDRVVVFHTSRPWRNRRERAEGIELFAKHRVAVVAAKGPSFDLTTAYGRDLAGLVGEFDTMESEVKSERVQRAAKQRADEGRRNGALPYGWRVEDGQNLIHDAEAGVVNEIVDRLLAGESQKAVVADLNARNVPSPQSKTWRPSSVRKVALRDSNAARRVHRGEVVGRASWPALVDDDRHDRVVALLRAPERRTMRDGARRHLLTYGVGECGVCGDNLRAVTKRITRRVAKARILDNPEGNDHSWTVQAIRAVSESVNCRRSRFDYSRRDSPLGEYAPIPPEGPDWWLCLVYPN
ncbi:MAG: recombinase family protein [Actinomycetota bacterium]|nr:recombinase family protein [Actinomycetota bacterium]